PGGPGAALAVLLPTEAFSSHICFAASNAIIPAECCLIYATRRIPRKFVDDYYETSSSCSKPGIIFHTKRGRKVCADPKEPWVQEYITVLELSA
uniref:C-C motif chemokine n=1 Tax=Catagonus wagneri TaxID=51154 RepID=A0A8C3W951_9CETA